MKDFNPYFEDITLFMKLPVDGNKCSQGFLLQKSNCPPSQLLPGMCVYETDPVISYTTQQEQ